MDVGGLDIQKQEIREAVELPLTHFELYQQIGIDPPRGVLLWGYVVCFCSPRSLTTYID
jgi:26S proteasome regulatory subunit T3